MSERPKCCTARCDGWSGREILNCYTSPGTNEDGVPKEPGKCYLYFQERIEGINPGHVVNRDGGRGPNSKGGGTRSTRGGLRGE